jgi:hypothetical protein
MNSALRHRLKRQRMMDRVHHALFCLFMGVSGVVVAALLLAMGWLAVSNLFLWSMP